jgi:hypothetical protein
VNAIASNRSACIEYIRARQNDGLAEARFCIQQQRHHAIRPALGKRSGRLRDHRPVGSWNENRKRVVISPVGVRKGAPMFGIKVINGHKVEPRARVAAKELPETIELRDAPALQPSLEESRQSTERKEHTRGAA